MLSEMHTLSKNTIEVLTKNMISGDVTLDRIFEFYKDESRENVIKLLLRCKKMFEARVEVKKILMHIVRMEHNLSWIKEQYSNP